jgi:hypothetical protein
MLERPFNATFIFAPAKHTMQFTIEDKLISVQRNDYQACQPQTSKKGTAVVKWTEMYCISGKGTPGRQPNDISTKVLDMQNNSGRGLVPPGIRAVDVLHLIKRREDNSSAESFSRSATGTTSKITIDPGWMIISKGWSASPWHADASGYCTCIVGVDCEKIWHVPKCR